MMSLLTIPSPVGGAVGAWRHPEAWQNTVLDLRCMIELAQIAERGKFDAIFLADGNGVRQLDDPEMLAATSPSDRPAVFEPTTLLSALSMCTEHIGLVATATTTYEEPYLVARRFASLDHLSAGRAGWNVVTTSDPQDALNFSYVEHVDRAKRYARAVEFVDVVKGLWDSWDSDAFIQNRETGRFLDPARMHVLNYKGEHFSVRGPLNITRGPQGHPVVFTAGQSEAGLELAAKSADCVFAIAADQKQAKSLSSDLRGRMVKYGRAAEHLKIIPSATVVVATTAEEAESFYHELSTLIPPAVGVRYLSKAVAHDLTGYDLDGPFPELDKTEVLGFNSMRVAIGTMAREQGLTVRQTYERVVPARGLLTFRGDPVQVADQMEAWYANGACDGFMVSAPMVPRSLNNFVDLVVPELQRRGLFRREYESETLRGNMGLPIPTNRFFPKNDSGRMRPLA